MFSLEENDNEIVIKLSLQTILFELKKLVENTIQTTMKAQNKNEPSPTQSDLLTRKQACNFLNISLPTLDARIKDGSIPCLRIGKKVLFDKIKIIKSITRNGGKI